MPSVTNSTAVLLCIDLLMLILVKVCSLTRGMQMTLLLFDFDCCYILLFSVNCLVIKTVDLLETYFH